MRRNGFTLTELAVVITMMAVLSGVILLFYQGLASQTKDVEQQKRIDGIVTALRSYQKSYGMLPCPAVGSLLKTDPNYGIAAANCTSSCTTGLTCTTNAAHGVVPFKTLNISPELTTDFHNNHIAYIVDKNFTSAKCNTAGHLIIRDSNNNASNQYATFVVLSHGTNATGAFSAEGGSATACNASVADGENCNNDETFKLQKQVTASGATYFDDFIGYGTNVFKKSCFDDFYGCTMWLDAADYCSVGISTAVSPTAVTSFQDKGPSYLPASQASGALMPSYVTTPASWINGNNIMSFNSNILAIASSTMVPTSNFSVTAVFRTSSLNGTILGVTSGATAAATGGLFIGLSSGKMTLYMNGMGTASSSGTYNDGLTHIVTITGSTSNGMHMYVDGGLVSGSNTGSSSFVGQTHVTIGGNTSTNGFGYFTGQILEVTAYSISMSTAQRRDLEVKLADKWAVKY